MSGIRSVWAMICGCLALVSPGTHLAAEGAADAREGGRRDTARFFEGKLAELHGSFDDQMQAGLTLDALKAFRDQIESQLGTEAALLDEIVESQGGYDIYRRVIRMEKFDAPIDIVFAYSEDGKIAGFFVRPQQLEAPSEFLEYETKTPLRLPFEGAWDVFWGGRSIAENYHAAYPDQRFAYDLLVLRDGSSHEGDGTKNEQYHAYGRPILAPGAGTVVASANDIDDNFPGEMNPKQPMGNHVILDHGNGEFSFLAHFKKGSVAVKAGDRVTSGQKLGLTGNSGNTSEPHIHYHLQTTADFGKGQGLPAQFLGYRADGATIERGEPGKGQTVSPN